MGSQRKYLKKHWRMILDDYLSVHTEYRDRVKMEVGEDLTGFTGNDIPYEMGDFMPVFLVDDNDNLVQVFDYDKEELVPLFDGRGKPTKVKVCDG